MAILLAFIAALAVLTIFGTIAMTARSYDRLPSSVPMHFGPDGSVNSYGPRPFVWAIVFVQIVSAAVFAGVIELFLSQNLPARAVIAMAGFGDLMLFVLWRAQRLIISTALAGRDRADLRPFYWFFGVTMVCVIALVTIAH